MVLVSPSATDVAKMNAGPPNLAQNNASSTHLPAPALLLPSHFPPPPPSYTWGWCTLQRIERHRIRALHGFVNCPGAERFLIRLHIEWEKITFTRSILPVIPPPPLPPPFPLPLPLDRPSAEHDATRACSH